MTQEQPQPSIGIIGAGVVGTTLAVALSRAGYPVSVASSRSGTSAEALCRRVPGCTPVDTAQEVADTAAMVLITTPDDIIGDVAASVRWRRGQAVVHCSGAKSLDVLEPAQRYGAQVGCFHPLQAFSDVEQALESLPGTTFAIEADGWLKRCLTRMARVLGGRPLELTSHQRVLYHASAVTTCGFLVGLTEAAMQMWQAVGLSPQEGLEALLPLMETTLRNMAQRGTTDAFVGPLARGDVGTIRQHLEELERRLPHLVPLYCHLGLAAMPLARHKGRITVEQARALESLFREHLEGAAEAQRETFEEAHVA